MEGIVETLGSQELLAVTAVNGRQLTVNIFAKYPKEQGKACQLPSVGAQPFVIKGKYSGQ
ncbi:MAG TPA: hypothetical protein VME45_21525 [Stellaceae bacterium]|nr:hypothetical protein [Stellaceae bacterium]